MRILLSLSVAVLTGLLMTRVAKPLKLPSVTAYLVAGVLIGPYCLGLLGIQGLGFPTMADVESLSLISDVALGFIAFSIGSEFRVSELKKTGKQAAEDGEAPEKKTAANKTAAKKTTAKKTSTKSAAKKTAEKDED